MKLSELKDILANNQEKSFQLILPAGEAVPVSFHITEIALVNKKFIDCGGTYREVNTCQLQVWLGPDDDHLLSAKKLAGIIAKAEKLFLNDASLSVEFEYENKLISQYKILDCQVNSNTVVFSLGNKHTDCLAKDVCGVAPKDSPKKSSSCCSSNSSCC